MTAAALELSVHIMSTKAIRQNKIKEILQSKNVCSQEELVDFLKNESIDATQATLSRDFAELGVIRVHTEHGMRYVINVTESGSRIVRLLGYEILNITYNESLIVIRTLAGRANGVAHYIDRADKPEILGTVAGDDTVLIIPDTHAHIPKIVEYIKQLAHDAVSE
jgi:transcriptional regulator of arginine metabolism